MPRFSVGLPFFRSKYIGWLALESLCRQSDVDFEWELIIVEERNDEFLGIDKIKSYAERLKQVGCSNIDYVNLDKWVPLSIKLKKLIRRFSNSEVCIWNPDDYFAPPKLLHSAYKAIIDTEYEWFCIPRTIFYDILSGRTMLYKVDLSGRRRWDDSTGRAFKTTILKKATEHFDHRRSGCDGMVYRSYKKVLGREPKVYLDNSDNWKYGLNTKGLNNISIWQMKLFNKITPPFMKCDVDISTTIPEDILNRLEGCKKYINMHKRGLS